MNKQLSETFEQHLSHLRDENLDSVFEEQMQYCMGFLAALSISGAIPLEDWRAMSMRLRAARLHRNAVLTKKTRLNQL